MGMYGLSSLSEVFDGKIPLLNKGARGASLDVLPPQEPTLSISKPLSPLDRTVNLKGKGVDIEAKIFGGIRGTDFGRSKLTVPQGTGFEKMLGKRNLTGQVSGFEQMMRVTPMRGQASGFEQMMRGLPTGRSGNPQDKVRLMLGTSNLQHTSHLGTKLGVRKVVGYEKNLFSKLGLNVRSDTYSKNQTQYGATPEDIAAYWAQRVSIQKKPGVWKKFTHAIGLSETPEERQKRLEKEDYEEQLRRMEEASVAATRWDVAQGIASSKTWWQVEQMKRRQLDEAGVPYAIVNGIAMTIPEMSQKGISMRGGVGGELKFKKRGKGYVMEGGQQMDVVWPQQPVGYPSNYPVPGNLRLGTMSPTTKLGKTLQSVRQGFEEATPFVTRQKVTGGLALTGGGGESLRYASALPGSGEGVRTMSQMTSGYSMQRMVQLPTTSDYRNKVQMLLGLKTQQLESPMSFDDVALQQARAQQTPVEQPQQAQPTVVSAGRYETPPGPPPSPDMKWSPYSKKWVSVVRGPYNKQR